MEKSSANIGSKLPQPNVFSCVVDSGRTICTDSSPQSSRQLSICCIYASIETHADSKFQCAHVSILGYIIDEHSHAKKFQNYCSHPPIRIDIDAIMTHPYFEDFPLPFYPIHLSQSTQQKFAIAGHTFDFVLLHRYHVIMDDVAA